MECRGVRVVEQVDIALFDLLTEASDDGLAGLRSAGQVVQEANPSHQQRSICTVEGHHQVVTFVGDRTARHVLQRDDRLFHHPEQAMADDREGDGIDLAHENSMTVLR